MCSVTDVSVGKHSGGAQPSGAGICHHWDCSLRITEKVSEGTWDFSVLQVGLDSAPA